MKILFKNLEFQTTDAGRIVLAKHHLLPITPDIETMDTFVGIELAGGPTTGANEQCFAGASYDLRYVNHKIEGNTLTILQRSTVLEVCSVFRGYDNTNAIRVSHTIKNISAQDICLEWANTLNLEFSQNPVEEKRNWYLHKFTNTRYAEVQPVVKNFFEMGITCRFSIFREYNVGNMSSRIDVPQALIENRVNGQHFMFQMESFSSWFYQVGISRNRYYLHIGGPNQQFHAWNKYLAPGATYQTISVAFCIGSGLNDVLAEITRYRRSIIKPHAADSTLPVIFNEYMHCTGLDPYEARTLAMAPTMAKLGCKYYVIDCGWHSDAPGDYWEMYKSFGNWFECRKRFPRGLKFIADYLNGLGMKFGLWIEPEVVGTENQEMIDFYGPDCFFMRNGQKVGDRVNYLLDFRHPKVIQTMTEAFDRMVNEYGVEYIKYDGAPCCYLGTDKDATSLGDGLEQIMQAFLDWTQKMMERYPHVIFEDCSGGAQRMDYKALSMFQMVSTSDQTDYSFYPYIVGNVFWAVLPEQAGVWAYPIENKMYDAQDEAATNAKVTKEHIVLNMLNAMLGRFHMASRLHLLDDEKQALIQEAVEVYNKITPHKLQAVPYLPKGYSFVDDTFVAVGLKTEQKVYLGVWNLNGQRKISLPLPELNIKNVSVAYPQSLPTQFAFSTNSLTVEFSEDEQARLFEIEL